MSKSGNSDMTSDALATQILAHSVLNEFGDVNLHVSFTEGRAIYQASSVQLIAHSSFFAKMLGPDCAFSEAVEFNKHSADPAKTKVPLNLHMSLEDKSPAALRIVLRILHGLPHGVTRSLTNDMEFLYQIALVVDYLDCGDSMKDWGVIWFNAPVAELMEDLTLLDKMIFISDVFRREDLFEEATKQAILRAYTRKMDPDNVFWDIRTESQTQEKMEGKAFTAIRPSVLETVMRERESLGKWLADKVTSINIYFDGFPHFMSMAPRDDRKHIMHHCRQKVDACDWIMCGAIRHWIHRWKLSEWATSAYLVHDMTVGQLGNGLSQLRFPRYSSPDSLSNHDCAPLGMSDDFLVAIVNQRLETLKGLKLNLSH